MNEKQREMCVRIFEDYLRDTDAVEGDRVLDDDRETEINIILPKIRDYLAGKLETTEFKKSVDSRSKTAQFWGFKGIKGMMFFNLLISGCRTFNIDIDPLLKESIQEPKDAKAAEKQMSSFYLEVLRIRNLFEEPRKGPSVWAIPFFLTFFWQIQNPQRWPVQYTSCEKALEMFGLWSYTGDVMEDWRSFLSVLIEVRELYTSHLNREVSMWQVEHVLYWYYNSEQEGAGGEAPPTEIPTEIVLPTPTSPALGELPKSYVPPIVSVLPRMAHIDPEIEALCKSEGQGLPKAFEDRVAIALRMLGFDVQQWGQGQGSVPDGVAFSRGNQYAIIYDAKASKYEYELKSGARQFMDYIRTEKPRLRDEEGIDMIFFAVISGTFAGGQDKELKRIRMETGVNQVVLLPAESLLVLIQKRLQSYSSILGRGGLLDLLDDGGLITKETIEEVLGR